MDSQWCRIDQEVADSLDSAMPIPEEVQDASNLLKILGDPTRFAILCLLEQKALCVNDLSRLLSMSQTAISHQLKVLRHNRLVIFHREGKMAVYSLIDEHIVQLMNIARDHVKEMYK
jgi:DNA-binding transcriptional ArsR family regulator